MLALYVLQVHMQLHPYTAAIQAHSNGVAAAAAAAAAGAPPSPPPGAVSRQLLVYTTEGGRAPVTVLPGVTTVGQLRAMVAETTRSNPDQASLCQQLCCCWSRAAVPMHNSCCSTNNIR
jgi:hypothetical protein